jgi:signal transduction histidine kinase
MKALITDASPQLVAIGKRCEAALESVGIIISCCAHQRRIVDDILTLSKLDSKLLEIAPSLTNLDTMLFELEKMFDADAQKFDVALRLKKDLANIQWAMLDTGRLTQVLTNLMTNAAKFTHKEAERTVTITVGISRIRPSERDLDVEFVPAGIARERNHAGSRTGSDEEF